MGTIRKRAGGWRAEVRRRGLYRSAEFRTRAAAAAWITQVEADYLAGLRGEPTRRTLAEAIERYAREVSPRKRGARRERLRLEQISRQIEVAMLPIAEVRPHDLAKWRDTRLAAVGDGTVLREIALLRSVFETARREWGWIRANPLRDVSRPPTPRPRQRRVSDAELEAIEAAAGGDGPWTTARRVAMAFRLAVETGMRAGELRSLSLDQIDLDRGVARLDRTKNGDSRDVPLSSAARALLARLADSGSLFPMSAAILDQAFRRLRDRAGIVGLHFHDSRAEAATRLSRRVDVLTLARILGHRDVRSLMTYYRETAGDIARRLG